VFYDIFFGILVALLAKKSEAQVESLTSICIFEVGW